MHKTIVIGLLLICVNTLHSQDIKTWTNGNGWPSCELQISSNIFFNIWTSHEGWDGAVIERNPNHITVMEPFDLSIYTSPTVSLVDNCLRQLSYDVLKKTCNKDTADKFIVHKLLITKISEFATYSPINNLFDNFGHYLHCLSSEICLLELNEDQVSGIIKEMGHKFGEQIMTNLLNENEIHLKPEQRLKYTETMKKFIEQWIAKEHNFFKDSFAYRKHKFFLQSQRAREELFELLEDIK